MFGVHSMVSCDCIMKGWTGGTKGLGLWGQTVEAAEFGTGEELTG